MRHNADFAACLGSRLDIRQRSPLLLLLLLLPIVRREVPPEPISLLVLQQCHILTGARFLLLQDSAADWYSARAARCCRPT
jgi:hypothetical protein